MPVEHVSAARVDHALMLWRVTFTCDDGAESFVCHEDDLAFHIGSRMTGPAPSRWRQLRQAFARGTR